MRCPKCLSNIDKISSKKIKNKKYRATGICPDCKSKYHTISVSLEHSIERLSTKLYYMVQDHITEQKVDGLKFKDVFSLMEYIEYHLRKYNKVFYKEFEVKSIEQVTVVRPFEYEGDTMDLRHLKLKCRTGTFRTTTYYCNVIQAQNYITIKKRKKFRKIC